MRMTRDLDWHVVGIGHFDGDVRKSVLLRHPEGTGLPSTPALSEEPRLGRALLLQPTDGHDAVWSNLHRPPRRDDLPFLPLAGRVRGRSDADVPSPVQQLDVVRTSDRKRADADAGGGRHGHGDRRNQEQDQHDARKRERPNTMNFRHPQPRSKQGAYALLVSVLMLCAGTWSVQAKDLLRPAASLPSAEQRQRRTLRR